MIVAWGYIEELGKDGFTYIDGDSWYQGESGMVGYHYVAYDDPKIHGAGRPNWDGWEPDDKNIDTKPEPTPEPMPAACSSPVSAAAFAPRPPNP